MTLRPTSAAFGGGERVPVEHTCEGAGLSPPRVWSGAPAGTESFALVCDDPDAPRGTWSHWAVYGIPAGVEKAVRAQALAEACLVGTKSRRAAPQRTRP